MQVKEIRQRLFMTINEFASAVGVSRQTVSNWEHGKHPITPIKKAKIMEICKKNSINLRKIG